MTWTRTTYRISQVKLKNEISNARSESCRTRVARREKPAETGLFGREQRAPEPLVMKNRAVGHKLRALGIATERLDAAGRGIPLLDAVRQRVHKLAGEYNVPGPGNSQESCQYCR